MRSAIRSVYRTLIDSLTRCAKSPQEAGAFAGDVESWLRLIGHTGDVNGTAMELRRSAVTTLLNAGDVGQAKRILPAIPGLTGLHLEAQGKWEAAAEGVCPGWAGRRCQQSQAYGCTSLFRQRADGLPAEAD